MLRSQPDVFVEVERGDLRKIEPVLAVHADEFAVRPQRRAARREPEHTIGFRAHELRDDLRGDDAARFGRGLDDDFHFW